MSSMPNTHRRKQAGYTLLMVVFMVASMLILAAAASQSVLTQGRREREEEMVWRGQQYARAIGLYYRKFGKYPTKVDDLVKQTNGVRFLRQAYTDPMNKDDGSWRFIYVGPNGQLIGSLRRTSLLQNTLSVPGLAGTSAFGAGLQPLSPPAATTNMNQPPGTGQAGQPSNPATAANPLEAQPEPLQGSVLGGNIIGVGSKIKKPSFRIYLGGDTYEQWEFIWNPTAGVIGTPSNSNYSGVPGIPNPNVPPQPNPQAPVVNGPPPGSPPQ